MDSQIEGVHFPAGLPESTIARRLLAVNLSDLAATGALPAYGFLALSAARDFDHRRFFKAFLAASPDFTLYPAARAWEEALGGHCPTGEDYLRLTPARHGTDGFFAAIFERRAAPSSTEPEA